MGILWNPQEVHLSGFLATPFTLSTDFHIIGTKIRGVISNVYGPPRPEQKPSFLESISDIKALVKDKAWILGGGFNMIRNLDEKKGGIQNLNYASNHFNAIINDLNLIDVRTSNDIFTWNNKQTGDRGIACRLDRFLLSESIMMAGGDQRAVFMPVTGSDHWPIILEWENVGVNPRRPFRFEKF